MKFKAEHDEVLAALERIGNSRLAASMAVDRKSGLQYCGVRVPDRRALEKEGFSFSSREPAKLRQIWDSLWLSAENADVMSCALDHFKRMRARKGGDLEMWRTVRNWVWRIENWAHADDLCTLYSRILEAHYDQVMPELVHWNRGTAMWPKRISIVSLIHNTGKNAVFLPARTMLPMISRCLKDNRDYMQKAVGWVLRELRTAHPEETEEFMLANLTDIAPQSLTRALERVSTNVRAEWRGRRAELLRTKTVES